MRNRSVIALVLALLASAIFGLWLGRVTATAPREAVALPSSAFVPVIREAETEDYPVDWTPPLPPAPSDPVVAQRQSAPSRIGSVQVPGSNPGHGVKGGAGHVSGKATWYCSSRSTCTRGHAPGEMIAAAGSELRVGDWRGRVVTVTAGARSVRVRLVDACWCKGPRVIDLSKAAFARLASPSRGVIAVTVEW